MHYFHEEGTSGKYREVTEEEIQEAIERRDRIAELEAQIVPLRRELAVLQGRCPHNVVYDEKPHPYDVYITRRCLACGVITGQI